MARDTFEDWIPEEDSQVVIQALNENSAIEAYGRPEPMGTDTKRVPRDGGFTVGGVAKAGTYTTTAHTQDNVELIARKVGGAEQIAEEDLGENDVHVDTLAVKRRAAARALAIFHDNAALGATGETAVDGATVLFTSVYMDVRTNGTGSQSGYVADANWENVASDAAFSANTSAATLDALNDWLGNYEEGDFFDEGESVVIASPRFRKLLRGVRDSNGDPFMTSLIGAGSRPTYQIAGYPVRWSRGARTSELNSQNPQGNPLLVIANRNLLISGKAKLSPQIPADQPGFALQRARNGIGFLSDQAYMKAAIRRGFRLGTPFGASVLEVGTPASL